MYSKDFESHMAQIEREETRAFCGVCDKVIYPDSFDFNGRVIKNYGFCCFTCLMAEADSKGSAA